MGKLNNDTEKIYKLCFKVLIAAAAVIYGTLLVGNDVWYDEAYTFGMLRHGVIDMCRITAADVHPPLYYILLKIFTAPFKEKMLAAKIFSLLCMLLIMIIGGIHTRRIFNRKVSICFMGMFMIFPFMLPYSAEIRMYALAALFVFLSALYAYYMYENDGAKGDAVKLIIFSACSAYTHYFAFVSVCVIYLILLIAIIRYKKILLKKWFIATAAVVVLYIPWLGCFISQLAFKISNEYWIDPVNGYTVLQYMKDTFSISADRFTGSLHIFVFIMLFVYMLFSASTKTRRISALTITVWAGTIALGVIVSIIIRPVFVVRYSVPAVPLLLVFAAAVLTEVKPREFAALMVCILFAGGVVSYAANLQSELQRWDNGFSHELLSQFDNADGYIILDNDEDIKIEHFKGVLAYYEEEKPIYSYVGTNASVPFDNIMGMEEFDSAKNNEIILLKKWSSTIPEDLLKKYKYSYAGHVATDSPGNTVDIYRLVAKQ